MTEFDAQNVFHSFDDFVVKEGNAAAYDAVNAVNLIQEIRNTPIRMSLAKCSGLEDDLYWALFNIPNFERYKELFQDGEECTTVFVPAPIKKPQKEKEQGEKDEKDDTRGWRTTFMADEIVTSIPLT